MGKAIGPSTFIAKFDAEADKMAARIINAARKEVSTSFTLGISVPSEVQDVLRQRLRSAGFGDIKFHHDYRDGNYITVTGNPYATQNVKVEASEVVDRINDLLTRAEMRNGCVTLDISVPSELQAEVRRQFLNAGWSRVTFDSDPRDGSCVHLNI